MSTEPQPDTDELDLSQVIAYDDIPPSPYEAGDLDPDRQDDGPQEASD